MRHYGKGRRKNARAPANSFGNKGRLYSLATIGTINSIVYIVLHVFQVHHTKWKYPGERAVLSMSHCRYSRSDCYVSEVPRAYFNYALPNR